MTPAVSPPQEAARDGVTAPPAEDEDVNLHYAVFTLRDGSMWELDGRKSFPVNHGPSSRETLLQVGCRCCPATHGDTRRSCTPYDATLTKQRTEAETCIAVSLNYLQCIRWRASLLLVSHGPTLCAPV